MVLKVRTGKPDGSIMSNMFVELWLVMSVLNDFGGVCCNFGMELLETWSSCNTALPVIFVRPFSVKWDEKIIKNHKITLF
jgi:hypothetical protein